MRILKMNYGSRLILSLFVICTLLCGCGSMKDPDETRDTDRGEVIQVSASFTASS